MIELVLEVYKSLINIDKVFYCSSPITSGKRLLDFTKDKKLKCIEPDLLDKDSLIHYKKLVIEPNILHAKKTISKLRQVTGNLIIDPTELTHIEGFTQNDWRILWQRVIEEYVSTAIFIDDWQYSKGCVHEFLTAHCKDIPTLDEELKVINIETGIKLVTESKNLMDSMDLSVVFFEDTINKMNEINS